LSCLTASTVAKLFADRLSPDEQQQVHVHADDCAVCRRVIAEVARDQSTVKGPQITSVARSGADTDVRAPHVVLGAGDQVSRYVIERFLGAGAMGAVYEARDPELGRRVAIKIVAAGTGGATEGRAGRLVREAQAMARLTHPNIVQIYDAGRSDDVMFIAMQRIDGTSLREHLAATREPVAKRIALMRDAGRGLATAHAAGIIHRDLKPDNILIDSRGVALVGDFGLALVPEDLEDVRGSDPGDNAWQTTDGAVLGTPAYMAPEIKQGGRGDALSDQYSFGVTLAEVVGTELRRIRKVIERACAEDPRARYPSMTALLAALEPRVTAARAAVGAVALGAVATIFIAWPRASAEDAVDACRRTADEKLQRAWSGDARRTALAHLAGLATPGAATTSQSLVERVDRYANDWLAMRREACAATRVRGEQSATLLDLRMACLDDRLAELAVVEHTLATLPVTELASALGIGDALGELSQCSDTRSLERRAPRDPEALALSRSLGAQLAEANATIVRARVAEATGGKVEGYEDAMRVTERVLAEARTARLPVIEAQALRVRSHLQGKGSGTGDPEGFYQALAIGDRLADPAIRVDALIGLLSGATAEPARAGEVPMLVRLTESALAELPGEQHMRRGKLAGYLATFDRDRGELAKAEQGLREAVKHLDAARGPGDPNSLNGRRLLARVLMQEKRVADVRVVVDEVFAAIRKTYGDPHPLLVAALNEVGQLYADADAYSDARATYKQALAMAEALHGPSHPQVAIVLRHLGFLGLVDDHADGRRAFTRAVEIVEPLPGRRRELAALYVGRGEAELATGDAAAAVVSLERGFALWAESRIDRYLAPTAQYALAQALWQTGGDRARARTLATEALETYRTTKGPWSPTVDEVTGEVDRWLKTHK
jgi:eukaryotic-like serine/threonine-protein kinase